MAPCVVLAEVLFDGLPMTSRFDLQNQKQVRTKHQRTSCTTYEVVAERRDTLNLLLQHCALTGNKNVSVLPVLDARMARTEGTSECCSGPLSFFLACMVGSVAAMSQP